MKQNTSKAIFNMDLREQIEELLGYTKNHIKKDCLCGLCEQRDSLLQLITDREKEAYIKGAEEAMSGTGFISMDTSIHNAKMSDKLASLQGQEKV